MKRVATKLTPVPGQRLLSNKAIQSALLGAAGPAKWHEDEVYRLADQPAQVGAALVEAVHKHLITARIGYLFKEKLSGRGKITLATAMRVTAKLAFFSELDFLIEVNWSAWMHLTPEQRVALIDHELCHCGVEHDDDGEKRYTLIHHDVEEFGAIIRRWGLWKEDLAEFGGAVREQLDFLAASGHAR